MLNEGTTKVVEQVVDSTKEMHNGDTTKEIAPLPGVLL
jgi:hypothetical protein